MDTDMNNEEPPPAESPVDEKTAFDEPLPAAESSSAEDAPPVVGPSPVDEPPITENSISDEAPLDGQPSDHEAPPTAEEQIPNPNSDEEASGPPDKDDVPKPEQVTTSNRKAQSGWFRTSPLCLRENGISELKKRISTARDNSSSFGQRAKNLEEEKEKLGKANKVLQETVMRLENERLQLESYIVQLEDAVEEANTELERINITLASRTWG